MNRTSSFTAAWITLALLLGALPALAAEEAAGATGKVNINTAEPDQLVLLPRVGPAIAQRIVEFREQEGKFEAPEDLMLVRGIGEKTFELLEPYVAVEGETTLEEKVRPPRRPAADESSD